ncbi:mitochondrial Rho GTPase [Thraustotheca clavata]|uniref:Mitochondrial Rho GTPase n=1 Tax=Thraustotheca clavata TaxID=74557 RepID=A0A1W0AB78_9STRA|nr:mitochondrial Rho GTPase [Thraustotheca clavata]
MASPVLEEPSGNAVSMVKQRTIRLMVLGDEKVGKSSLISALVSQHSSEHVPRVLHDIVIPTEDTRENVVISLHDTSSNTNDVMEVIKTINRSDAAIVVYDVSRPISSQRLSYWLDLLKVTKVMPVVLVGNKCDLLPGGSEIQRIQTTLRNYKFIVQSLECSSKSLVNVKRTFGLAQKAVLYPLSPLYDVEKKQLQPTFVQVLRRIFRLFDEDRDGMINREELNRYQAIFFMARLKQEEIDALFDLVQAIEPNGVAMDKMGLYLPGFIYLSELAIQKNKPEHCWQVLRSLGYSDELVLNIPADYYEIPRESNEYPMVDLSNTSVCFLKNIFDQFATKTPPSTTPILTWTAVEEIFSILPNDKKPHWFLSASQTTLELSAWLALWSLELAIFPKETLIQLFYLGFDLKASMAVDVRHRRSNTRSSRLSSKKTVRCLLFGSSQSGKTMIVNKLVQLPFESPGWLLDSDNDNGNSSSTKTDSEDKATDGEDSLSNVSASDVYPYLLHNVHVVNDKDSAYGEKYLILSEVSESYVTPAIVQTIARDIQVDIVCYVFDGTNPDSVDYLHTIEKFIPDSVPCMFVCTKSDLMDESTSSLAWDRALEHCASLELFAPLSVSEKTLKGLQGEHSLYSLLVHRALHPQGALPFSVQKRQAKRRKRWIIGGCVVTVSVLAVAGAVYYKEKLQSLVPMLPLWLQNPSQMLLKST